MCVAERPSAGGKVPVWQVEHRAVTTTWVWFHFDGNQVTAPWHVKQFVVPTGMWFIGFAVAPLPWQLAQFVAAVNVLWSILAPSQVVVDLWQVSHAAVVATWVNDLPTAGGNCPVWQLVQLVVMVAMFVCTLARVFHAMVPPLWQVSQLTTRPPNAT
jgi:hypothetical protein